MDYKDANTIRKFFINMDNYVSSIINNKDFFYNMSLSTMFELLDKNSKINIPSGYEMSKVMVAMIECVFVTDLYISLTHKKTIGTLTEEEALLYFNIKRGMRLDTINSILEDPHTIINFKNAVIEFYNDSALKRIEKMKSLNESDISILSNFNPFFIQEYYHFNISVDMKFINKHINIWINRFGADEAKKAICNFIFNLSKIDKEYILEVLIELLADMDKKYDVERIHNLIQDLEDNKIESLYEIVNNYVNNNYKNEGPVRVK